MLAKIKRPSENFGDIIKVLRSCGTLVGLDVSSSNFGLNWINSILIIAITIYFIFSITTIVNVFEENPTFILEASCMLGSVLQGVSKLATAFKYKKNALKFRLELEELYEQYEKKGSGYVVALNNSCERIKRVIKLFGLCYAYALTGIVVVPIVMYIVTKKHYLMMHFLLPGLDIETDIGYFLTTAAHVLCLYSGAFGLFTGDMFVIIYLLQPELFADIFKLKIKELNELLEDEKLIQKHRELLRDIISWHKKYNDYNIRCNTSFYYIITAQVSTAGISILCSLYIFVAGDWPGVYAYLLVPILSLYGYCMLGTKIQICNDIFTDAVYDIHWYMLPKAEQKLVLFVLAKSQQTATVSIAGIAPLTVETGLEITKTIYSIFMMMLQTVAT